MKLRLLVSALFLMLILVSGINAQWTPNTALNNAVCDTTGDQATPKIAAIPGGGCYIVWFDNRSGNYAVYLQKIDPVGNQLFGKNGLLISNNPQNTSLQDYNIDVDSSGNAVIVFTDRRNGSVLNPFAYLISPSGAFLWGPNGVSLTDSTNISQNIPVVTTTSDGNYVFAWVYSSSPNRIAMQKLNSAGIPQWGAEPIKLRGTGTQNFNYPKVIDSDNGSVIMCWDAYTGNIVTTSTIKIFIQKFAPNGSTMWASPQDTVQNIGRVSGISYQPYLVQDGQNGCVISWQEDRDANNIASSWVQRYNSAGVIQFPKNGSEGSILASNQHFQPTAAYMQSTGDTYMFWTETNGGQTVVGGLYGQKFDAAGSRQWGDNGKEFKPLDNNQLSFITTFVKDTSVVVNYTESIFGSGNANVKIMRTGPSSEFHWSGGIITASSYSSAKVRKQAVLLPFSGTSVMTWSDNRSGSGDIYAQSVKFNGEPGVCSIDLKAGIEGFWNNPVQVSDTVICYMRNTVSPYNIIGASKVVLDSDGSGRVSFPILPSGTYYLTVIHRNSIETWSSAPLAVNKGINSYDFTTSASQAYGNNMVLKAGRYCFFSGDVNRDGSVELSDISIADNDAFQFATGYIQSDVNGDNSTDITDLAIIDNNAFGFVQIVRP